MTSNQRALKGAAGVDRKMEIWGEARDVPDVKGREIGQKIVASVDNTPLQEIKIPV